MKVYDIVIVGGIEYGDQKTDLCGRNGSGYCRNKERRERMSLSYAGNKMP